MSSEVAIRARGLSKCYAIFKRPEDRLKQMLSFGRRKYYQEFWSVRDVEFDIHRGETVGIVGRNGSGKSTLLQMVCGTLTPTSGELAVKGRVAALLELGAGFNPEFTGRENVFLAASVLGLKQKQINERFVQIEEFAGIGDFIDQPVKTYSSGMYARLAFAVIAHVDADILIIDEILAVGDAAFTQKCMKFIRRFKAQGTLLFVSHDTGSVVNLCDRAVWLDRGYVREVGLAKDVCHNYLAALHSEKEDASNFKIGGTRKAPPERTLVVQDSRDEELKSSQLQNEIKLFQFDPEAPWFGKRGATIRAIHILGADGEVLSLLYGAEVVALKVTCSVEQTIKNPIVGFFVKDRLGQHLFGDNTYLTYRNADIAVTSEQEFSACFRFQMPYLPTGDYSIIVAVAEGTQEDHVQHHWIDDALFFRVESSHVVRGLVGIPMLDIDLQVTAEPVIAECAMG